MRRRTFVASVVVTLSLAEAGCDGASTPPSGNGTEERIAVNPPGPDPEPSTKLDLGDAPEPQEPEPREPEDDIRLQPDGTCLRFPHVECPKDPEITCNPPPPEVVPCPEAVYPKAIDTEHVTVRDDDTCWEDLSGDFECPKGAMCNPPPPRRVQCPPK